MTDYQIRSPEEIAPKDRPVQVWLRRADTGDIEIVVADVVIASLTTIGTLVRHDVPEYPEKFTGLSCDKTTRRIKLGTEDEEVAQEATRIERCRCYRIIMGETGQPPGEGFSDVGRRWVNTHKEHVIDKL